MKPFLVGKAEDWFQISIPLDPKLIDPFFVEVAKVSGGEALFGGGSDLVEMGLLQSPKLASPAEVNVIRPKQVYDDFNVDAEWTNHVINVPAFGKRPAFAGRIGINGESGRDLRIMVENANKGRYLIEDQNYINVPFKHGHIVRVNDKGEARLYFRTKEDFLNYRAKKLSLPDEEHCPPDFHLRLVDNSNASAAYLRNAAKYGLIVYARAARNGWSYTPKSKQILQTWVDYLKLHHPRDAKELVSGLRESGEAQGVSTETMGDILREFNLAE